MNKILSLTAMVILLVSKVEAGDGYTIGQTVKNFNLKNIDGKMVSLDQYQNSKGVVVIFTCNHCPFSKKYEQRIIDLHKTYSGKGFPVVAINPNDPAIVEEDSYENMVKTAKKKKYPFPYLFDETQQVAKDFGASRTPHVFLLQNSAEGFKVVYIGAIDNNAEDAGAVTEKYVEKAMNQLLNNEPLTTTQTKAIGCSIKWKKD
jgi:peroxiredoxin